MSLLHKLSFIHGVDTGIQMLLLNNVEGISKEAVEKKSEGRSVAQCLVSCFHCFGSKQTEKKKGRGGGEERRREEKREKKRGKKE